MESYILITFESTHLAIKTEKQLEHLDIDVIPTPRQLSTSCGISIRASIETHKQIKDLMGSGYNEMSQCYKVSKQDGILLFTKL